MKRVFVDLLVEKSRSKFITSIYWKQVSACQYLRRNYFSPQKSKTKVILTLSIWDLAICSPKILAPKLDQIKFTFLHTNGYPEHIIKSFMAKKMKQFHALPKFGPESCSIYLRVSRLRSVFTRFEKRVNVLSNRAFPLLNHALFTLPTSSFQLPTTIYCLLIYRKTT